MEYRGQWRDLLRHGQGTLFQKGLFKYTGTQPSQTPPHVVFAIHHTCRMGILWLGAARGYVAFKLRMHRPGGSSDPASLSIK